MKDHLRELRAGIARTMLDEDVFLARVIVKHEGGASSLTMCSDGDVQERHVGDARIFWVLFVVPFVKLLFALEVGWFLRAWLVG